MTHDAPITPLGVLIFLGIGLVLGLLLALAIHAIKPGSRTLGLGSLVLATLAYVPFAIAGGAGFTWVAIEVLGAILYGALAMPALNGSSNSMKWLFAGWAVHPLWDVAVHVIGPGRRFVNPYAWPVPCISFDLVVAGYLACVARWYPFDHRDRIAGREGH